MRFIKRERKSEIHKEREEEISRVEIFRKGKRDSERENHLEREREREIHEEREVERDH